MVRICSVHSSESSESMSFLKVDRRKKQLTLCETLFGGHSATASQRRLSSSAPKTFSFDTVFSQDASQVSQNNCVIKNTFGLCVKYPQPYSVGWRVHPFNYDLHPDRLRCVQGQWQGSSSRW